MKKSYTKQQIIEALKEYVRLGEKYASDGTKGGIFVGCGWTRNVIDYLIEKLETDRGFDLDGNI